jgi:DnaJ-class molecular chaperone
MKENDIVKCPNCNGSGRVRDWLEAVATCGLSILCGSTDECDRCEGTGFIRVKVKP